MSNKNYYTVNEISKRYNLTNRTLQYYDELGLLSVERLTNGYRIYNQQNLYTLDTIVILKNYGLELSMIKYFLYTASIDEQREILHKAKEKIEIERKKLDIAINNINTRMNELAYLADIEINKLTYIAKNKNEYELLDLDSFKYDNGYFNTPIDNSYMISVFNKEGKLINMAHKIGESNIKECYIYIYYEYNNNFEELLNSFIKETKDLLAKDSLIYSYPILMKQNKYLHYFEAKANKKA